ncbi:MAG: alpha/beta hydrolase, partial [Planctomycetota bacterium]
MEAQTQQQAPKRRRGPVWSVLRFLRAAAVAYGVVVPVVWIFQSRLVYFPNRKVRITPGDFGVEFEEVTFPAADGTKLSAWFLPVRKPKGVVLFCHGNAGNMSHRMDSLAIFRRMGYSVLIFDYRGYGRSEGSPSEEGTYQDARAAWDYLVTTRRADPRGIVLFGRSLGGAVAAKLATEESPAGLILESTFTSINDLGAQRYWFLPVRLLSRFRYQTLGLIGRVNCPLLVVHSREDELIPFDHGRALFEAAGEPRSFLEISGTHNDGFLTSKATYTKGLKGFLRRCVPGDAAARS